jgi:TIGR03009 family protein
MMRRLVRSRTVWIVLGIALAVAAQAQAQQAPVQQGPIGPPDARQFTRPPMQPRSPFPPPSPEQAQLLERVLASWEDRSSKIQCYRCTFQRWEYDSVFGPKDTYNTYGEGVIQYAMPDKGLFRVDKTMKYTPQPAGEKPQYVAQDESTRQQWICDGNAVIELNYAKREMIRRALPPEMQGKAIADGPLPFLFGAKAAKIKERYWVRLVTPDHVSGEYHLEARPKTLEDAANFKFVVVVLDQQEFLPSRLVVYDVNFRPGQNESRTSFQFNHREVNAKDLLSKLNLFHREFYEPALPSGWKKIEDRFVQPAPPEQRADIPQGPLPLGPQRQATAPRTGPPSR